MTTNRVADVGLSDHPLSPRLGPGPAAATSTSLVPLTLDEYQQRAAETAIYPEKGTGSAMALAYVGLGLGEAGEIQNKIKKVIRDNGGALGPDVAAAIAKEYGDLLWYVANGVAELGFTLGDVAAANLDKLAKRKTLGLLGGSGDDRENSTGA